MGRITCNAEGFAGETGAVNVLEGGERDTNELLSCSHYALKGLAAGCIASAIPHYNCPDYFQPGSLQVKGGINFARGPIGYGVIKF